jgi:hypothetical protein
MTEHIRIAPSQVVAKLRAMQDYIEDRNAIHATMIELLWFLQATSTKPQGLHSLAQKMIDLHPDKVRGGDESSVWNAVHSNKKVLTREQSAQFWNALPLRVQRQFEDLLPDYWKFSAWEVLSDESSAEWKERLQKEKGFPQIEVATAKQMILTVAAEDITDELFRFCTTPTLQFAFNVWCFQDAYDCAVDMMRAHAVAGRNTIAHTAVTKRVFHALDFSWFSKGMVQLRGDPRFGKTEAVRTWCEMYPGRARRITVSEGTTDREFFVSVAKGLGIDVQQWQSCVDIKNNIEELLEHARLMVVMDEAHYLLPTRYSESTPPSRMNWVRAKFPDKSLACALVITPQSFDGRLEKFAAKTHYRFEQWFGRTATFELPSKLTAKDFMAVAEFHFPQMRPSHLKMIAGSSMLTKGCLNTITQAARYAEFIAKEEGRETVTDNDVRVAIALLAKVNKPDSAKTVQPVCSTGTTDENDVDLPEERQTDTLPRSRRDSVGVVIPSAVAA